ncbi:hypothetical protein DFJ77DRAFT_216467 [Powellomyces hirtus]|nr:hypothetical protein DFJ77DRAFT_216467 [Powellomyces hirtus]
MEAYPIRTLADIYKNVPSKVLSPMQFAGLKHLDDFRKQIPREEMTTWETLLKETAQSVVPGMQVELGGIYRRSCLFSQKITVHMTHESWESSGSSWDNGRAGSLMLQQLHDKLIRKGVLVDDIKYSKRLVEHSGVYRLPDGVCRRLEIQISPYDRHWYALFLSTRSNKLITRLRTKATSMGYQLERGYILDSQGVALKGLQSEEDLFAKLDEVYEPPSN